MTIIIYSCMLGAALCIALAWFLSAYSKQVLPALGSVKAPGRKALSKRTKYMVQGSVLGLLTLLTFPRIWIPIIFLGLYPLYKKRILKVYAPKKRKVFQGEAYKVYRYLSIQMSAGLRASDILKTLPCAVESAALKAALTGFSSAYLQTMNFQLAETAFYKQFDSKDAEMLLTVIHQSLESGKGYDLIKNQERLMINRYFNDLEVSSQWFKIKGSLLTIIWCFMIFLLLAVPMVYELFKASHSIFQ